MRISYNKLWKMLIDKNMKKSDLREKAGISSASLAKLGKGDNITTDVLLVFPPRRFRSFRKHMPFILQRRSIKQKSKMQSIRIQQNHLS